MHENHCHHQSSSIQILQKFFFAIHPTFRDYLSAANSLDKENIIILTRAREAGHREKIGNFRFIAWLSRKNVRHESDEQPLQHLPAHGAGFVLRNQTMNTGTEYSAADIYWSKSVDSFVAFILRINVDRGAGHIQQEDSVFDQIVGGDKFLQPNHRILYIDSNA